MDEALPLLLGSVVFVFALKYLFSQNDNQPPNNNNNNNININNQNEEEVFLENLIMAFPNIPVPVIRDQLARRHGDLDATSEALLRISHRYPVTFHPVIPSTQIDNNTIDLEEEAAAALELDKQKWERDKKFRGDFLKNRKLQMLKEAQRKFLEKSNTNNHKADDA